MAIDPNLPSPSTELEFELSPGEIVRRAVWRHLAGGVRSALQTVPCEPNTPEAIDERDVAVIAIATSLNPVSYAEAMYATKGSVADARQIEICAELMQYRGDFEHTSRLRNQYASLGRESRGALNALMRMQRERQRMDGDATSQADAIGRSTQHGLTEALESLAPPVPLPPMPDPALYGPKAGAAPDDSAPPAPKITRPPAPLPPSMAHLADRPDRPEDARTGRHASPGYAPWEPGCGTPVWYTVIDDNLTQEQLDLRAIWRQANDFTIVHPLQAAAIRRHGGVPPGCDFELPSPDVMHVLLHDNSSNLVWADTWQPHPEQRASHPEPCRVKD